MHPQKLTNSQLSLAYVIRVKINKRINPQQQKYILKR